MRVPAGIYVIMGGKKMLQRSNKITSTAAKAVEVRCLNQRGILLFVINEN